MTRNETRRPGFSGRPACRGTAGAACPPGPRGAIVKPVLVAGGSVRIEGNTNRDMAMPLPARTQMP